MQNSTGKLGEGTITNPAATNLSIASDFVALQTMVPAIGANNIYCLEQTVLAASCTVTFTGTEANRLMTVEYLG